MAPILGFISVPKVEEIEMATSGATEHPCHVRCDPAVFCRSPFGTASQDHGRLQWYHRNSTITRIQERSLRIVLASGWLVLVASGFAGCKNISSD